MHSFSGMLFSAIVTLVLLCPAALAVPQVTIGNTTLVGRDVTTLKLEFFGGKDQSFDR
jgi:acetylcholinesterase